MNSKATKTYRITELANLFGLSRSTLLHYDRIGLLQPSGREQNGYRYYTEADRERLNQISRYRQAGLPLSSIEELLSGKASPSAQILEQRLAQFNSEIQALRQQQQHLLRLLEPTSNLRKNRVMDKSQWVQLLRDSGMTEADMQRWHIEFERSMPEQHQDFLESLGISDTEITQIRAWSRESSESELAASDGKLKPPQA